MNKESSKLTMNSKIKELYANPIGKDVLSKILLQMGKSEKWLLNPLVGNMQLKTIAPAARKFLGGDFSQVLLDLLNSEMDRPAPDIHEISKKWWKEAVFYQIYPRSFKDSNNDGIGDLGGIVEKLDYLKDLGIDAIWLSPIYDSPNDDNGYDIRNYKEIMEEFGTMSDFDYLLDEIHKRDMRLIMDLVVNHTSDEHPWFKKALNDPTSKYRDYYFFKKSKDGNPPNNWTSFFSGSAWNHYPGEDVWALHLFSKKQMDLNWDNPEVRQEVCDMVGWWLEKGVDGFRLDVINYISKASNLPPGNEAIYQLMGYCGIEHYFYGPNLHKYLHQLKQEAFVPYDAFAVGETPGVGMEMGKLLTAEYRGELDMIFSFDHLETPGKVRYDDYDYDLNYLKQYLIKWTREYPNYCWMSLFYDNHDNPRMVSKVNEHPLYRDKIAKLLGVIQLTSKGTPFIYQGQEIGMVNQHFSSISDLRDVESLNMYQELIETMSERDAFAKILAGSRDHARTPIQWSDERHAGFSTATPWIVGDDDYLIYNVENQSQEDNSTLNFYKQLIQLRKQHQALVYGEVEFLYEKRKDYFVYKRILGEEIFTIECNLGDEAVTRKVTATKHQLLLSNYQKAKDRLQPYEANVYFG